MRETGNALLMQIGFYKKNNDLTRRRNFVMAFCLVGIVFGFMLIALGLSVKTIDTLKIGLKNENIARANDTMKLGIEDIFKYLNMIAVTGSIIVVMSLVGLAFTYLQEWHGMVFFCGYLMLSNLIMVSAMSFLVMNAESVAHKVQDKARRGWLIADRLVDDVKDFENRNACCGWHNVFDYCEAEQMSIIMQEVIMEHTLESQLSSVEGQNTKSQMVSYTDDVSGMADYASEMPNGDDNSEMSTNYDGSEMSYYASEVSNYDDTNGKTIADLKKGTEPEDETKEYFLPNSFYGDKTDEELIKTCGEKDEKCVCYTASIADEWALLEYQEKKCTRPENDATGDYLLVSEVRNCTDPDRGRCNLNGCGDIFSGMLWTKIHFALISVFIISIFYSCGVIFTIILTNDYNLHVEHAHKVKIRQDLKRLPADIKHHFMKKYYKDDKDEEEVPMNR